MSYVGVSQQQAEAIKRVVSGYDPNRIKNSGFGSPEEVIKLAIQFQEDRISSMGMYGHAGSSRESLTNCALQRARVDEKGSKQELLIIEILQKSGALN